MNSDNLQTLSIAGKAELAQYGETEGSFMKEFHEE